VHFVPADPPQLLPGRPAAYWKGRYREIRRSHGRAHLSHPVRGGRRGAASAANCVVAVLAAAIGVFVFSVAVILAGIKFSRAERNERRSGYTTLSGRAYRRYWKLTQGGEAWSSAPLQPPSRTSETIVAG
jgi:hypothetical protein